MLYHLMPDLTEVHSVFNLFRYITFRSAGALGTSLLVTWWIGPRVIALLRQRQIEQVIRRDGPSTHLDKRGTPTMGGIIVIVAACVSTLLWAELANPYTVFALLSFVVLGALGFMDDYLKVVRRDPRGLVGRYKLVTPAIVGLGLGIALILYPLSSHAPTATSVPFFSGYQAVFAPVVFVGFTAFVVSGTCNSVNLTDGLDGLASGLVAIAAVTFAIIAYVTGRFDTSAYLGLFHLAGAGELTVFAVAVAGAAIGFLWFNSHPASVFMGDTGSLALGGALGVMAVLLKAEFLLLIAGFVFVLEAGSVMAQRGWFKYTRLRTGTPRRLLRMAPLHHHYEMRGCPETKIVVRFWIVGLLCAMLALSTLKIR